MKDKEFFRNYWVYALAFIFPILLMSVNCYTRNSWMFGNGSILVGDAGNQYIYLYEELWNKVHSGKLSFFSWNAAGGFDFYLNLIYYMISPATLFILLLPKHCLENAIQFFIVLKWALLSCTSVFFFMNTKLNTLKKNRKIVALTLGLSYAMSGFFLRVLHLFNWMDTLILFPILLLLIEQMVRNGNWKMYYLFLTVAILCNFYIAFPVCIFLLLWFSLQLQMVKKKEKNIWFRFLGSSFLAAFSCMAIILPSIMNVGERYTPGHDDYIVYQGCMSLVGFISGFFALAKEESINVYYHVPMGVLVLSMLLCFIKMKKNVKYVIMIILLFVLISFFIEPLNIMWHGFTIPHGFSPRYAFTLTFMINVMALCVIERLKQVKIWHCFFVLLIGLGLFCYTFFHTVVWEEYYVYLITVLSFVFSLIVLFFLKRGSIEKRSFFIVFCVVCLIEIAADSYQKLEKYNVSKPENISYVGETTELAENLSFGKGERFKYEDAGYNIGMSAGVPALSGFISYFNGNMGELVYNLGMLVSVDSGISYVGGTPLLDAMFNIAYDIGIIDTELVNMKKERKVGDLSVYRNDQLVGLGYMVNKEIIDWDYDDYLSYQFQNEFVKNATGINSDLFETFVIDNLTCTSSLGLLKNENNINDDFLFRYTSVLDSDAVILDFTVEDNMDLYFTLYTDHEFELKVTIDDNVVFKKIEPVNGMNIPIGKVKKGQKIKIICYFNGCFGKEIQLFGRAMELNKSVWKSVYNYLSEDTYQIVKMDNDYISGTIETEKSGVMMTSIPALQGFDVYVDGKKVGYVKIADALIGVTLEKGFHTVEFRYHTPYAILGCVMSLCSIMLFGMITGFDRRKRDMCVE